MRFYRLSDGSPYFCAGPIFNKALETGFQRTGDGGFDFFWRFRTRGDHAGLAFNIELFGWMFEFNVHDVRHWDYDNDRWQQTPQELEAEYEKAKLSSLLKE